MSSLWNRSLFYLGLVDEDPRGTAYADSTYDGGVDEEEGERSLSDGASTADRRGGTVTRPGEGISGRRVEPPTTTRVARSGDRSYAQAGVYIHKDVGSYQGERMSVTDIESLIIVARNFSDAQDLADAIRGGRSVVLDLRNTEPEMVRRIIDFSSGLTYALDGKMSKISQGVILITPLGISLGVDENERLKDLGLVE